MIRLFLDYPSFLFLLVFFAGFAILRTRSPHLLQRLCFVFSISAIAVFLFVLILDLRRTGFMWHDEVNVLAVAAAYLHGEPMYLAPTSASFYSLLYGPSTFLVYLPLLRIAAHPLPLIRAALLAVNLANLLLLYLILRTRVERPAALALLPVATGLMLTLPSILLGTRGDPWLQLCLCAGLLCALKPNLLLAILGSGILYGLALDFKVTVLPVAALMLLLLDRRHGRIAAVSSAFVALAAAASLFLLPAIFFPNYIACLEAARHQQLLWPKFTTNLVVALFLVAPGLLLRFIGPSKGNFRSSINPISVTGLIALAFCIVFGSKDGAGDWHLWPMLPFLLLWTAYELSRREAPSQQQTYAILAAIALSATILTARFSYRAVRNILPASSAEARAKERSAEVELAALVHQNPSRNLQMGYGSRVSDERSNLRFELPLLGENYTFDENAVVESTKEHLPTPAAAVSRVVGCNDLWLIPHGDVPFSTLRIGALPAADTPFLFPDTIRLGFLQNHRRQSSGAFYDLWACPASNPRD